MSADMQVEIDYTNWKGERRKRLITPLRILFQGSKYHPEIQWLLIAWDAEKRQYRDFAMKEIHSWTPKEEEE